MQSSDDTHLSESLSDRHSPFNLMQFLGLIEAIGLNGKDVIFKNKEKKKYF